MDLPHPLARKKVQKRALKRMKQQWQLYVFLLIPIAVVIIFSYVPMYGITLAFKEFRSKLGILGSPWANPPVKHFLQFFNSPNFGLLLKNTLLLSLYSLAAGFPAPIILALCLNEVKQKWFKKSVQMITYAPYFISTVVLVGMLIRLTNARNGLFSQIIQFFGGPPTDLMANSGMFRTLYVFSGIWQGMGYSAIIYIAALSNVDPTLYEAAIIDGVNRFQKIVHIDIPTILPTVTLLLIMNLGHILGSEFDRPFTLSNPLVVGASKTISIFVYERGIQGSQFSLSTAVGLFQSVVCVIFLLLSNSLAKKFGERGIW